MAGRKERVFNCPGCGVEVRTIWGTRKFCSECSKRRHDEQAKKADAKRKAKKKAETELAQEDRHDDNLYFHDTPEEIQRCLNCKMARCIDCLSMVVSTKGRDIDA